MVKQPSRGRIPVREAGPDQIDVEVGVNLRRIRLSRGFSQTELGDALGISFQQVQKYERGANRVSASMLVKAARYLKIRPADLLPPDEGAEATPGFVFRFSEARGVAEIVDAYCAIRSPALRRALLQFVRAMGPKAALAARNLEDETESGSR